MRERDQSVGNEQAIRLWCITFVLLLAIDLYIYVFVYDDSDYKNIKSLFGSIRPVLRFFVFGFVRRNHPQKLFEQVNRTFSRSFCS
jgi:hypothetical protein